MKYSILIFGLLILSSCTKDPWSDEEKNIFLRSCEEEGKSTDYCDCFMNKTMDKFPRNEESHNISFEEAVELSKDCE